MTFSEAIPSTRWKVAPCFENLNLANGTVPFNLTDGAINKLLL